MKGLVPEKTVFFVFPRIRLSSWGSIGSLLVLSGKQDCGNKGYRPPAPGTVNSQLPLLFSCLFLFSPFSIANCNEHLKVISRYSSRFPPV